MAIASAVVKLKGFGKETTQTSGERPGRMLKIADAVLMASILLKISVESCGCRGIGVPIAGSISLIGITSII
jgi:hypothetical protein